MKKALIPLIILTILIVILTGLFLFTQKTQPAATKNNLIIVSQPKPQALITTPLTIAGKARGQWFFEASFPVILTDWDGKIIAESYAEAQSDWMTTEFVPFRAVIEFSKPNYGKNGFLILKKDNPSGLPEHDDALEIPILFSK